MVEFPCCDPRRMRQYRDCKLLMPEQILCLASQDGTRRVRRSL
uniref:Uncharacterized protein n=1 Tax=Lepeophtheirus salmonis TaxID=72036 RepID=A0A0K2VBD0_LEPSM